MKLGILLSVVTTTLLGYNSNAQLNWENLYSAGDDKSTSPWEMVVNGGDINVFSYVEDDSEVLKGMAPHSSFNLNKFEVLEIDDLGTLQNNASITSTDKIPDGYIPLEGTYLDENWLFKPFLAPFTTPSTNAFSFSHAMGYVKYNVVTNDASYYIDQQNTISSVLVEGVNTNGDFYSFGRNTDGDFCVFQVIDASMIPTTYVKIDKSVWSACYDEVNDEYYVITKEGSDIELNTMSTSGTLTSIATLPSSLNISQGSDLFFDGTNLVALQHDGTDLGLVQFDLTGASLNTINLEDWKLFRKSPSGDFIVIQYNIVETDVHYVYNQLSSDLSNEYSYTTTTDGIFPIDVEFYEENGVVKSYVLGYANDEFANYRTYVASYNRYENFNLSKSNENIEISIVPNPTKTSIINIKTDVNLSELDDIKLVIVDTEGSVVRAVKYTLVGENQIKIESLNLSVGTYHLSIVSKDKRIGNGRFVIE